MEKPTEIFRNRDTFTGYVIFFCNNEVHMWHKEDIVSCDIFLLIVISFIYVPYLLTFENVFLLVVFYHP